MWQGFELVERTDSDSEKDVTDGVVREGQPRHRTGDCVSVQLWWGAAPGDRVTDILI